MKVALLRSENVLSRRDINAAYSAFNIPFRDRESISDSKIIDHFHSHTEDQGEVAQLESREHLYKLGVHRQSDQLINASRQSVETYQDALSWLGNGVNEETPDDFLISISSTKVRPFAPAPMRLPRACLIAC